MTHPIYMDYNATTPLKPEVLEAMLPFLSTHFGNPSSGHFFGQKTKEAVENARAQVANLLRCDPEEITFTSGGTEANNLAIFGALGHANTPVHVITSEIEHPATSRPCHYLAERGHRVSTLGVNSQGVLELEQFFATLTTQTSLVTVMHANNETGVLQPIQEMAHHTKDTPTLLHTDAAQSVGKVPVHVRELGVDLLSVAGHKLYAPKGVGALYIKSGVTLQPFLRGAGHERGVRPGTENVASIVGLGKACALALASLEAETKRLKRLRDMLWHALAEKIKGVVLHGHHTPRLPNTLSVRFPQVSGLDMLAHAPQIAASTGSACHDGETHASPVILAMGVAGKEATGTVRLTLGAMSTEEEVMTAARALTQSWHTLTSS